MAQKTELEQIFASKAGDIAEAEDAHWWFSGKRKLVASVLAKLKPAKTLDIGCGTGSGLQSYSKVSSTYGCEFSEAALSHAKKRGLYRLAKSKAEDLPFKSGSFDAVTILDVLEHLDGDIAALSEINRILKKGGHVIINVPAHMFLWQKADDALGHKRRYSFSELKEKVENRGFRIKKLTYWNFLLFPYAVAFKMINKEENTKKHGAISNKLLHTALLVDNFLITKGFGLPFGISLFCIAQKK